MLAYIRLCSTFSWLLLLSVVVGLPVAAQVHGVPASVTSIGFGGSNNPAPGIRASVTSLGPNNFANIQPFLGNCCTNFFFPPGSLQFGRNPRNQPGRHHHRRDDLTFVPIGVPEYVPYPVPYAADSDDDSADDPAEYSDGYEPRMVGSGTSNPGVAPKHPVHRNSAHEPAHDPAPDSASKETAPDQPADVVPAQPTTVLVFKDGHRSDVVNYAIVGDTLFDFAEGRARKILLADLDLAATQKANDAVGVDFKVPLKAK